MAEQASDQKRITIHYVTRNQKKADEFFRVWQKLQLDCETQLSDVVEVVHHRPEASHPEAGAEGDQNKMAIAKGRIAAASVTGPVLVDYADLDFHAWGLPPSACTQQFCMAIGISRMPLLLEGFESNCVSARCSMALCFNDGKVAEDRHPDVHVFPGKAEGSIVASRGESWSGYDPIFCPDGFDQTFAEMGIGSDDRDAVSDRRRAIGKLFYFLKDMYLMRPGDQGAQMVAQETFAEELTVMFQQICIKGAPPYYNYTREQLEHTARTSVQTGVRGMAHHAGPAAPAAHLWIGPMTAAHRAPDVSQFDAEWFIREINPEGDSVTLEQFTQYFSTRVEPRDTVACNYLLKQLHSRFGLVGKDAASQLNNQMRELSLGMRHDARAHHYTMSW